MKIVILAGDIGKRLWPLSSNDVPKAFLPLYNTLSLLVETLFRVAPLVQSGSDVYIVLPESAEDLFDASLFDIPKENIIFELEHKSDTASMMFAIRYIELVGDTEPDDQILFVPTDHFIVPPETFGFHMYNATLFCKEHKDSLVAFLKEPTVPSTHHSYCTLDLENAVVHGEVVEGEDVTLHSSFTDLTNINVKPNTSEAEQLLEDDAYWFTDIYLASFDYWKSVWEFCYPEAWFKLLEIETETRKIKTKWYKRNKSIKTINYTKFNSLIPELPTTIFGYCIEKILNSGIKDSLYGMNLNNLYWCRLDNWAIVKHLMCDSGLFEPKDDTELHLVEAENNYVFKPIGKHIALFGVNDLVVIDTDECLLIGTPDSIYENL